MRNVNSLKGIAFVSPACCARPPWKEITEPRPLDQCKAQFDRVASSNLRRTLALGLHMVVVRWMSLLSAVQIYETRGGAIDAIFTPTLECDAEDLTFCYHMLDAGMSFYINIASLARRCHPSNFMMATCASGAIREIYRLRCSAATGPLWTIFIGRSSLRVG